MKTHIDELYLGDAYKELYGNKGRNLMIMRDILKLPVPEFFILHSQKLKLLSGLPKAVIHKQIQDGLAEINAGFVSVRSSPNYSLPGILSTTLNVNANDVERIYKIACAITESVTSPKVQVYKEREGITEEVRSAIIVQRMVYGNKNTNSGTGVVFSSNPQTGADELYGEFLPKAQGEALVGGTATPTDISKLKDHHPQLYSELYDIAKKLEEYFGDIQDIEFTYVDEKLYILQTRNAKKLIKANVAFQTRLHTEGKITATELEQRISNKEQIIVRNYDKKDYTTVTSGIGASSGLLVGEVAFNAKQIKTDRDMIYVAEMTSTDDIDIISKVQGLLTVNGGKTSHAAIVSRSWGKVCVVGASWIKLNKNSFEVNGVVVKAGDKILIDGDTVEVMVPKTN